MYTSVFAEYKSVGHLSKSNRRLLVNGLFAYIRQTICIKPSRQQIIQVCQDTLVLFPSLKVPDSRIGGIVCSSTSKLFCMI